MSNYLYRAGIALAGKNSVRTTHKNYIEFFDHIDPVPSWEQIQEKIQELEAAEPMRLLRIERNRRLTETDWIITKGLEQETDITKWKTYRQALRDLPKMITPDDSTEPLPAPTINEQGQLMFLHWPEIPK